MARWPTAVELYRQNVPLVEFKLYPGASHVFTNDMKKLDVAAFLRKARLLAPNLLAASCFQAILVRMLLCCEPLENQRE